MLSEMERLDKRRSQVQTRSGPASYVDTGGPARQFQRLMTSLHARDLLAVEAALARLQVPTLIVWGTGDRTFGLKWAYWLRDTIPGATEVVEIDGAACSSPTSGPPSSPRRCAAPGTPTRDARPGGRRRPG